MLAAIASPSSAVASCVAETKRAPSVAAAADAPPPCASRDRSRSRLRAKSAVGATSRVHDRGGPPRFETAAGSRSWSRRRGRSRSRGRRRPRRCASAKMAPGSRAMRTWLETGPFFCARPVTSSTEQPLPSRCAATREDRADRDDAAAADARDEHVPRLVAARRRRGSGSAREAARPSAATPSPRRLPHASPPTHRHEARAVALQARVVLVAGRLVDAALAAELGLDRLDRDAVRSAPSSRRSPRRPAR